MSDLEEIWGPRGRATVDPASIRPVRPAADCLEQPVPPPAAIPVALAAAVPTEAASIFRGRQPNLGWVAAGVAAAVAAVLFVAMAARSSAPPPRLTTGSATPTTIVSAAADLLGRARATTTTTSASEAAAGVTASPEGTAVVAPPKAGPPPPTPPEPGRAVSASGSSASPAAAVPPLALAEEAAHRFVDVIGRRDCDGLWDLLSRATQELIAGSGEPGERSGRDEMCEDLRSQEPLPVIRVHGPAEARGERAVVPLESEGEVEPLTFVAEEGRWVIDLFGDFAERS